MTWLLTDRRRGPCLRMADRWKGRHWERGFWMGIDDDGDEDDDFDCVSPYWEGGFRWQRCNRYRQGLRPVIRSPAWRCPTAYVRLSGALLINRCRKSGGWHRRAPVRLRAQQRRFGCIQGHARLRGVGEGEAVQGPR